MGHARQFLHRHFHSNYGNLGELFFSNVSPSRVIFHDNTKHALAHRVKCRKFYSLVECQIVKSYVDSQDRCDLFKLNKMFLTCRNNYFSLLHRESKKFYSTAEEFTKYFFSNDESNLTTKEDERKEHINRQIGFIRMEETGDKISNSVNEIHFPNVTRRNQ